MRALALVLVPGLLVGLLGLAAVRPAAAQEGRTIDLTLESTVDMAVENSYRVRQLQLGIERTRSYLRAERAELKSRVYMNLRAPEYSLVSEHRWNSDLHREELIRENSRMWRADFAIRQPVVFFGYPTNGYLSLNNRVYRYTQVNGGNDVTYYNRYFVSYEQPFFQPNHMKYNLEEAELRLEREEINFQQNFIDMVDDLADDYYDLFELAYERKIYEDKVANLVQAEQVATELVAQDSSRMIELNQIQVELANAREQVSQSISTFRLQATSMKQRLRLAESDTISIDPVLEVVPVQIDLERAIRYGLTLRPRLRELSIQKRDDEIDLIRTRGYNSFRMNLELTYGREMQDPRFQALWDEPNNSYTVGLNAYIPIWDWGERSERIQAERIGLQQTELRIEEEQEQIRNSIQNAVRNLQEYQERALRMEDNLRLAQLIAMENIDRYRDGESTALELVQSFNREAQTASNFLDAYLGYRQALLQLQQLTYYDFQRDLPLLRRFQVPGAPAL